jgi:hypothetical protein
MKAGRPHKNIYNCMRFQRMYYWVSRFSQLNDYQIAKRMYERDINASSSLDTLKGFIHHIKSGRIAKTKPYYIWLLAKALLKEYPDENRNWKVTEEFKEILNILCCKLHAVASDDKGFEFRGWKYYQEIFEITAGINDYFDTAGKIYSSLTKDWILDTEDIAIDIAELLGFVDIEEVTTVVREVLEYFRKKGIKLSSIIHSQTQLFFRTRPEFNFNPDYNDLEEDRIYAKKVGIAVGILANYIIICNEAVDLVEARDQLYSPP